MAVPDKKRRRSSPAWVCIGAILVLTLGGLTRVLKARYDTGEFYPAYSSLRADPIGTRVLYEALDSLPGVQSQRRFAPLRKFNGRAGRTLIFCGLDPQQFNNPGGLDAELLSRFVLGGGRLVIALNPSRNPSAAERSLRRASEGLEQETASLASIFKLSAKTREASFSGASGERLDPAPQASALGPLPLWHSHVFLDGHPDQEWQGGYRVLSKVETAKPAGEGNSPWRMIASQGGRPVIMERKLGRGSVVVCSDRYFLSNEALWQQPSPAFLGWLMGNASEVIFEETHLGAAIGDSEGIMTLARRYGMHGLFLGGLLWFALYLWRAGSSLIPVDAEEDLGHWRASAVAGQDAASGLEGLLRRGIAPAKLLGRCLEAWEQQRFLSQRVPAERRAKAQQLLAQARAAREAPATYRQIRDTLHSPESASSNRLSA